MSRGRTIALTLSTLAAGALAAWLLVLATRRPRSLLGRCPPGGVVGLIFSRPAPSAEGQSSAMEAEYAVFDARSGRPTGSSSLGTAEAGQRAWCFAADARRRWVEDLDHGLALYPAAGAAAIRTPAEVARAAGLRGGPWRFARRRDGALVALTGDGEAVAVLLDPLRGERVDDASLVRDDPRQSPDATGVLTPPAGERAEVALPDGARLTLEGGARGRLLRDGRPALDGRALVRPAWLLHPGGGAAWSDPPGVVLLEGGDGRVTLTRLTSDGRSLFTVSAPTSGGVAAPFAAYADGAVLVRFDDRSMTGLDARSGRALWTRAYDD